MAVQVANSGSGGAGSGSSRTFSFAVTGGADSLLLVLVASSGASPTSVTHNGDSLTKYIERDGTSCGSSIWYRAAPDAGTYNVVVTWSTSNNYSIGAVELSGVSTVSPFADSDSTSGTMGTSASRTVTPVIGGSMAIDCLSIYGFWMSGLTIGGGQTQIFNATGSSYLVGAGSYEATTPISDVTMSWSWGGIFGSEYTYAVVMVSAGTISVNVYDSISVSEITQLSLPIPSISGISDTITVSENLRTGITSFVNVSDALTVAPVILGMETGYMGVIKNEVVSCSEYVQVYVPYFFISIFDGIGLSELVTSVKDPKEVSVFDVQSVAEQIFAGDTKFRALEDTVSIQDFVSILPPVATISVFDVTTISDSVSVERYLSINRYDTVGCADGWIDTTTIRWGKAFPANRPRGYVDLF